MSNSEPYFLDDRVIIPDDVKKMSREQLEQEIARLEKEAKKNKAKKQKIVVGIKDSL